MLAFFLGAVAEPVSLAEQAQARTAIYANVSSSIEIEAPSEIQWNDLCLVLNVSPLSGSGSGATSRLPSR